MAADRRAAGEPRRRCSRSGARCRSGGPGRRDLPRPGGAPRGCSSSRLVDAVVLAPDAGAPARAGRAPAPASRRSRSWPMRRSAPTTASCCSPAGGTRSRGGGRGRGRPGRGRHGDARARSPPSAAARWPTRRACCGSPSRSSRSAWERAAGRGGAAGPHHRRSPGASEVSREHLSRQFGAGRRAQSQAGDRSDPHRLRRPAAGQPRLLHSHGGPASSTSPRPAI